MCTIREIFENYPCGLQEAEANAIKYTIVVGCQTPTYIFTSDRLHCIVLGIQIFSYEDFIRFLKLHKSIV